MADPVDKGSFQPIKGNHFSFRCYKGIKCFTDCCADLNLLLTPYDILRLKKRLDISSDDFLEDFTDTKVDNRSRFPMVYLKMNQENDMKCPFLSPDGCKIYEDRPGACRIYPIGRASTRPDGKRDATERFFIVKEKHCMGFEEDKEWTLEEWTANEGVDEYNLMNDEWMEIITSPRGLGNGNDVSKKVQMFYMSSYNLDRFRDFLLQSGFFKRFEVEDSLQDILAYDDEELLRFAFRWLRFSLFGEKTINIRE